MNVHDGEMTRPTSMKAPTQTGEESHMHINLQWGTSMSTPMRDPPPTPFHPHPHPHTLPPTPPHPTRLPYLSVPPGLLQDVRGLVGSLKEAARQGQSPRSAPVMELLNRVSGRIGCCVAGCQALNVTVLQSACLYVLGHPDTQISKFCGDTPCCDLMCRYSPV